VKRLAIFGLGAAIVAVLVIVLTGGSSPYVLHVRLADAAGLQQRSPVMIGGVTAGTITLHLGANDQVIADLDINRSQAPVGRNASVAIAAINFLGQKEAEITRGNASDPAPSGYTIPASHVTVGTDLDQVLDVLDPSTRARLAVLIDETGTALTGRRADFSTLLEQLPPSIQDANALLSELVSDNHTLADLVTSSDQFVSQVTTQRSQLSRLIGTVGQTAVSVEGRRQQLAQTLAQAPSTLTTLQTFLGKLQATTVPLGPAAQNISITAAPLRAALAQVGPFQHAAQPALSAATAVAPELTQLATQATPVVTQANPVIASLATFSSALVPVSGILNKSVDNLLAIIDNWSRAIQFRDGLGHVFRGEGAVSADSLTSIINRLLGSHVSAAARRRQSARTPTGTRPAASSSARTPAGSAGQASAPGSSSSSAPPSQPASQGGVAGLLQQLAAAAGGGSSSTSAPQGSLSSLLNYLVKP
jgi:ABC-type transporter Mla subunit MlaD